LKPPAKRFWHQAAMPTEVSKVDFAKSRDDRLYQQIKKEFLGFAYTNHIV
jgi:hypothetical protein